MPVLSVESLTLTDRKLEYSVTLEPASTWPVAAQAVTIYYNGNATPIDQSGRTGVATRGHSRLKNPENSRHIPEVKPTFAS